jgi:cytosine/adenosine deaminase-related metal-dependent hydrolase
MATVNFAAFFKEDYGTIEINKIADFMLLDANPLEDLKTLKNLQGIYYNQNFLDKKALDVMRESVLKALQN